MRRKPIACCIAAAALALSATAAVAQESSAPAQANEPAAASEPTAGTEPSPAQESAAPAVVPAGLIGAPPEGKGQVVFFRPNRFAGGALTFTVRENESDLGRLSSGRYFVQVAEPGVHAYEVGRNDTLRMEVEPGVTYYVQQNVTMGIVVGRAVLAPSDQATFEREARQMRLSEPPRH